MADETEQDSKTEEASEQKIRTAVEKGDTPYSPELATASTILLSLAAVMILAQRTSSQISLHLQIALEAIQYGGDGSDIALRSLTLALAGMLWDLAPILGLMALGGLAISLLQGSRRPVANRIAPQMSRISPLAGWSRLFGMRGLVEFAKANAKIAIFTAICLSLLASWRREAVNLLYSDPGVAGVYLRRYVLASLWAVTIVVVVLAGLDFLWQRFSWLKKLRMTRHDVKEEMKQTQGDPIVRGRMLSLARDRVRRSAIAAVPQATVVITNPTHYAVALRYVRDKDAAPVVIAKGRDLVALRIREVAEAASVPIVENKPLARSLFAQVEVDMTIPPELYRAVAEVIIFVQRHGVRTNA